jgi:hypothetical protein
MGIYRKVYQPFGDVNLGSESDPFIPQYQLDWPGIVGTANQIATHAGVLAPGAGVLAPSAAPAMLQAPPPGTPGLAPDSPPWLLLGGAFALYYFILK